jgi:hypothetical protein
MGYELNRLMRQFGVSSPTVAYSGSPIPVAPVAPGASATGEQATAYNALVDKYNAAKPQYEADRAAYEPYKQAYQERVMNTPMYSQAQFQAGPSAAVAWNQAQAPGVRDAGRMAVTKSINDALARNPGASPHLIRSEMDRWGISGYDMEQARGGSMWGAPLAMPNYGQLPGVSTGFTPIERMTVPAAIASENPLYVNNNNNYVGIGGDAGFDGGFSGDSGDSTGNAAASAAAEGSSAGAEGGPGGTGIGEGGGTGMGGWARGGAVRDLAQKYAVGGEVRKFRRGGAEGEPEDPMEAFLLQRGIIDSEGSGPMPMPAVEGQPMAPPVTRAVAPPEMQAALPPMEGRPDLMALLGKYAPQGNAYGAELAEARKTASAETAAFNAMLQKAISEPGSQGPSKAEMYFRLAAAFGAPTKTGAFSENLAKAGEVLSEQKKAEREASSADRARKLQLGLQAQQAKMTGAKEDLGTLRTLVGEEMKDKRTIAAELLKDYVKSGQPQSSAGKQALDEGLKPGTPEYQKRVSQIGELNVDRQLSQIQSALSGMTIAQATLALQGEKFQFQKTTAEESSKKLTPGEIKLKSEAESVLGGLDDSMSSLKRAYSLNPNTFDGTLADTAKLKVLEQTNPKDPRVLATREQTNLLSKGAVDRLKAAFGGNPTEGERAALLQLEGLDSKSKEERALIMKNTYKLLQARRTREQKRLQEITSGAYRQTAPNAEELE